MLLLGGRNIGKAETKANGLQCNEHGIRIVTSYFGWFIVALRLHQH